MRIVGVTIAVIFIALAVLFVGFPSSQLAQSTARLFCHPFEPGHVMPRAWILRAGTAFAITAPILLVACVWRRRTRRV
jgi:hypothetical protein